jgi:hypothetical protein
MIEERENKILSFGEKAEERKVLLEKLELLDKEIKDFDKDTVLAEIDELTDCAKKLGLIEVPQEECSNTTEECPLDNSLSMEA